MKTESSLAPDQDHRHNVPSSSQPPNKAAVPCRACGIAELKRYKEGPELQQESRYKTARSQCLTVCGTDAAGGQMKAGDPTGAEKTESDCW